MEAATNRRGRIELRLSDDNKQLLTEAAAANGVDLTSFILGLVVPAAREAVARRDILDLTVRDLDAIAERLDNPPPPTPALRNAAMMWRHHYGNAISDNDPTD